MIKEDFADVIKGRVFDGETILDYLGLILKQESLSEEERRIRAKERKCEDESRDQ
jgi:hypothetical protein